MMCKASVALTTHPLSSTKVKERVQLYVYSALCLGGMLQGHFYLDACLLWILEL